MSVNTRANTRRARARVREGRSPNQLCSGCAGVWQFCRSFLPPLSPFDGERYTGRENSYTQGFHHGTELGLTLAARPRVGLVRLRVRARASVRARERATTCQKKRKDVGLTERNRNLSVMALIASTIRRSVLCGIRHSTTFIFLPEFMGSPGIACFISDAETREDVEHHLAKANLQLLTKADLLLARWRPITEAPFGKATSRSAISNGAGTLRARSLRPLEKTRAFGMTARK